MLIVLFSFVLSCMIGQIIYNIIQSIIGYLFYIMSPIMNIILFVSLMLFIGSVYLFYIELIFRNICQWIAGQFNLPKLNI